MKKILSLVITLCILSTATVSFNVLARDNRVVRNNRTGIPCAVMYNAAMISLGIRGRTFTRAQARTVTHLNIRGDDGDPAVRNLRGIEYFTNVRRVTLEATWLTPEQLVRLERLPRLRRLTLVGRRYTVREDETQPGGWIPKQLPLNTEIRNLTWARNLRSLQRLEIIGGDLDIVRGDLHSLNGIQRLTNLRVLRVTGNSLTNLNGIQRLTNLTHIDASNNKLTDISTVGRLPSLRRLNVANNRLIRIPNLTRRRSLTADSPTHFGNNFSNNRLSRTQFRTKLPASLRRADNGQWLRQQIESQN